MQYVKIARFLGLTPFTSLIFTPLVVNAATINTYNFSQDGYLVFQGSPSNILVSGTFVVSVGSSNSVGIPDLLSIAYNLNGPLSAPAPPGIPPTIFSYNLTGGSSSFALVSTDSFGDTLCIGSPAAFGFTGCSSANYPPANSITVNGINGSYIPLGGFPVYTSNLAVVTLVSSVPVTQTPPSQIPEPSSLLGSLTFAILSTSIFVCRRNRKHRLTR